MIRFTLLLIAFLFSATSFAMIDFKAVGNLKAPKGGTFYYNLGSQPDSIHPIKGSDAYSRVIRDYTMDTLLNRDVDTWDYTPGIATNYEIAKDGMSFTFDLREGATFSDGKPVTAEDVKFSFEAIFDPEFQALNQIPYFEKISKVEVLSPTKVKFTAKEKYFLNFDNIATSMYILPKHFYGDKANKNNNKTILGSGPYMLEKYERSSHILLTKNPKWWGYAVPKLAGRYNFEKVYMRMVQEETVAIEMLKKGQLDFDGLTPEAYMKKTEGAPFGTKVMKEKVQNKGPKAFSFIGWNVQRPLFKDRDVRVALAHMLNRELMNEKFLFGLSELTAGPDYNGSDVVSPKVKAIPFDKEKATALLKKAGWADTDKNGVLDKVIDGKKTEFSFTLLNPSKDFEKYFTIFKEDLKTVGINLEIKQTEWTSFVKLIEEHNFDAIAMAWSSTDLNWDPKQIWHSSSASKGGSNYISYKNPEVDKLIDEGRGEMNDKKRIAKMQRVYELIANDAPYAFMFNRKYAFYAHSARIKMEKPTLQYGIGSNFWWMEPIQ
jgi:microcin C transport system substrate-binding protein